MIPVAIVAVAYLEPEYRAVREAITRCNVPVVYVDRQGVGSLAAAYNNGARQADALQPEFLWFVSNVGFGPTMLPRLLGAIATRADFAAIHPAFASDHLACQPDGSGAVKAVPFLEFTCPLVRAAVFRRYPLDERMPYWGHDLDWGHRVRAAGWKIGVDHGAPAIEHAYIRHADRRHPITRRRHQLRKAANASTTDALVSLYGPDWRRALGWL
jgi:GT2 family glycosyltransferase